MDMLERKFLVVARQAWRDLAPTKCKLVTYIHVQDFTETSVLVNLNLPHYQHSILAWLLCGILPIDVEVGRFTNIKRHVRFSKLCKSSNLIEDEIHLLITCDRLKDTQDEYIKPLLDSNSATSNMSDIEKVRWLLSGEMLQDSAPQIEALFRARQSIIYKPTKQR